MKNRSECFEITNAPYLLAAIVQSSDDAIISKDLMGIVTSWNAAAERMFGYSAIEVIGKSISIIIPPDRQQEEANILTALRNGEHVQNFETIRRRKDGTLIDISLTVSPVRDLTGTIIGASKIARDISERRRAQEFERLVFREMRHRIKNTLSTVQFLARQTLHSSPATELSAFSERLEALARAYDLIAMEEWDHGSILDVVRRALSAYEDKTSERLKIEGPDQFTLTTNQTLHLTMALHELATNAVKYGALSNDAGTVHVAWTEVEDDPVRIRVCWRESGGSAVRQPTERGLGLLLLERGVRSELLGAKVNFDPAGVVCSFDMLTKRG